MLAGEEKVASSRAYATASSSTWSAGRARFARPELGGLGAEHDAAREEQVHRGRRPGEPGQDPCDPVLGNEPAASEGRRHLRVIGDEADVAHQRENEPDPGDRPVHRGDDRLGDRRRERLRAVVFTALRAVDVAGAERLQVLHVGPRAETAPRAGDDDRPHLGVGRAFFEQVEVRAAQLGRPRVQAIGTVESQYGDSAFDGLRDHFAHVSLNLTPPISMVSCRPGHLDLDLDDPVGVARFERNVTVVELSRVGSAPRNSPQRAAVDGRVRYLDRHAAELARARRCRPCSVQSGPPQRHDPGGSARSSETIAPRVSAGWRWVPEMSVEVELPDDAHAHRRPRARAPRRGRRTGRSPCSRRRRAGRGSGPRPCPAGWARRPRGRRRRSRRRRCGGRTHPTPGSANGSPRPSSERSRSETGREVAGHQHRLSQPHAGFCAHRHRRYRARAHSLSRVSEAQALVRLGVEELASAPHGIKALHLAIAQARVRRRRAGGAPRQGRARRDLRRRLRRAWPGHPPRRPRARGGDRPQVHAAPVRVAAGRDGASRSSTGSSATRSRRSGTS